MGQQIEARVLTDSVCKTRLTTWLVTAPRVILAEINTHRMLSRNAASSRAIPVSRRIKMVEEDPFVPVYWGANQAGMQAEGAVEPHVAKWAELAWRRAAAQAVDHARELEQMAIHKQVANRLLEPFTWCTQLITTTEVPNLMNLRVEKSAEPLFFELAGQMLEGYAASTPRVLQPGDWHVPFGDHCEGVEHLADRLKIASARAARLSYERHDGTFEVSKDVSLTEGLIAAGHMSPVEHSAQAIDDFAWGLDSRTDFGTWLRENNAHWDGEDVWWGNFRWWKQYRKMIPGENRTEMDVPMLLERFRALRSERGYFG